MKSVVREKRNLSKDQIVAELEARISTCTRMALRPTPTPRSRSFFGQDWTRMRAMTLTVTHLHEHRAGDRLCPQQQRRAAKSQ
jgi:hypothetical protein